ncbi:MAG: hypothetical protein V7756_03085 [Halopseudomonas sp.]|uniref:hypothetical protein n=1 Tax=Halopseudomonas sp. TaxID=2901191 RepID=UPI0030028A0D
MSNDQNHPGENNLPHKPRPDEESPHNKWEGPVESEDLNEVDAGEIAKRVKEEE